jgi:hypothetical protein
MSTYSDHEQRLLDQQSGAEMDRLAERRARRGSVAQQMQDAEIARWAEEGRRQMWAEYDRCMAGEDEPSEDEEDAAEYLDPDRDREDRDERRALERE